SPAHEAMLRDALAPLGLPVLGAVARAVELAWRDRHLGLVPVVEQRDTVEASLDRLAVEVAASCDLDSILGVARAASRLAPGDPPAAHPPAAARVAVAGGPAFSFTYPDNLELLEQAGAELVPFDPRRDPALPDGVDAVYAGGGFPEVFVEELAAHRPLLSHVRERVGRGPGVLAQGGGLAAAGRSPDRPPAEGHPRGARAGGGGRRRARPPPGSRTARVDSDPPVAPAGTELRGHEFHYSELDPPGDALSMSGRNGATRAGYASPRLLASY